MKVTLTFDLPDDAPDLKAALDASAWQAVLWNIDMNLRNTLKYHLHTLVTRPADEVLDDIRTHICEEMDKRGLVFDG